MSTKAMIFAILLILAGCSTAKKEAAEAEPPTPVQVDDVTRGPIDLIVSADAVLYPFNQANVTSKISATVRRGAEDETRSRADGEGAQQARVAAKTLYDNRVELQKQGALAQKLVDDAKVAKV